jgi:hypothetical protein
VTEPKTEQEIQEQQLRDILALFPQVTIIDKDEPEDAEEEEDAED